MSYDFLGTFNQSQFERFLAFARSQLPYVGGRIQHLEAECSRLGTIIFRYSKGVPQGFSATPSNSYIAKLLGAYEVLGGNPFIDLRVRLRSDPVFKLKGSESTPSQFMSNGEVIGSKGLSDAPTAELMLQAKSWISDTLQQRFDRLERKIRRAMDYSDELKAEIATLKTIQLSATTEGSLEYIAAQITQYLSEQNYRAVFNDRGGDTYGFHVYAPFSSYDIVGGRVSESPQRQNSGYVGPGESGSG